MRLFTATEAQHFPKDKKYFIDPLWNRILMNLFVFCYEPGGKKNFWGEWSHVVEGPVRAVLLFPL